MFLNIIMGFFVVLQLVAGELIFFTLGYLILSFPEIEFHMGSRYFGTLITLLLLSQVVLGAVVWSDFRHRIWKNDIKSALWARIFSFGCFNYGYAMFNIIYYLIIMRDKMESGWWNEKQKKSSFFKLITNKSVLHVMSKVNIATVPFFFFALALVFIGGGLNSDFIGLLGFRLAAIWMIAIVNFGGIFQFLIMIHMVSKKWDDSGFEDYFSSKMIFLPAVALSDYYNSIMSSELNASK